jgi:hypothetical protein
MDGYGRNHQQQRGVLEPNDSPAELRDVACVDPEATMITRECSGSRTPGSKGRTKPFSTTPATANG